MSITKVGIIGYGAIGPSLHSLLREHAKDIQVVAILDRETQVAATRERAGDTPVEHRWDAFIKAEPDIVVECAGHAALREHGTKVLESGCDLVISSVGAMADTEIETALRATAQRTRNRIVIPSGAVGGLDALAAAKPAGIDEVLYTSRKQPKSWSGTAAESMIDLANVTEPTTFFTGNAREAALKFPQNANVVAAVALAGGGFERTKVTLIADPTTLGNRHIVFAHGSFGEISTSVLTRTLPENPKTSMLAPFSVMRAIMNLSGFIII
jgi:aspartate dehydrogenase